MESYMKRYLNGRSQKPKRCNYVLAMCSASYWLNGRHRRNADVQTIQTELYDAQHVSNDLSIVKGPILCLWNIFIPSSIYHFETESFIPVSVFFFFNFCLFYLLLVSSFISITFFFFFLFHTSMKWYFFFCVDIKELFRFDYFFCVSLAWIIFQNKNFIKNSRACTTMVPIL